VCDEGIVVRDAIRGAPYSRLMATWRRYLGFPVMTLVALVVAHSLVFLLAYGSGYQEALAHSGHDGTWGLAVVIVLAAALGLVGLGTWRLYRLGVVARARAASEGGLRPGPGGFAWRLVGLWVRLAGATTLLFIIQENLEHQHVGEGLPGLAVLGSAQYPNAIFVIAAVALAVAFVVVLFRWRRDVLVARITDARERWHGAPRTVPRRPVVWVERRHASIVLHRLSGRAPPQLATT
jgi:uncharacterized membrane protein